MVVEPSAYFLLEGSGQAGRYPGMAWGNGFTLDKTLIAKYNLSDPTQFFQEILARPAMASRVVLSPHIYGPEQTVSISQNLMGPVLRNACTADERFL